MGVREELPNRLLYLTEIKLSSLNFFLSLQTSIQYIMLEWDERTNMVRQKLYNIKFFTALDKFVVEPHSQVNNSHVMIKPAYMGLFKERSS